MKTRHEPRNLTLSGQGRRVRMRVAIGLALCVAAGSAQAAEWTVAPEVRIGSHYDDNIRMTEDGEGTSVWGAIADLAALAQWRTERSKVLLRPRAYFSKYPGDEDEDSSDQYLDFAATTQGLRSQWQLRGNVAREEVLRGEDVTLDFPDPDLDDPEFGETGRIAVRRTRTSIRVAPSFSYRLSEKTQAGAALNYRDVSYDGDQSEDLRDYSDARAELFLIRLLSPRSRFRTTAFASSYEADAVANDSTSYGLRGRYEHDLTETYQVYFDAGAQRTEVEAGANNEVDDSRTSFLLDAGVLRQLERTRLLLSAARAIQPSGSGFLRQTDRVRFNVNHRFLPRWSGQFAALYMTTESVDEVVEFNDRDYYELRAGLAYDMTRAWVVEAGYRFRHQDYEDTPGSADSNEAYLSLIYRPRGQVWSR
jgi:opacity protein-like surface antigen